MIRLLLVLFLLLPVMLPAQQSPAQLSAELAEQVKLASTQNDKKALGQTYGRIGNLYLQIAKLRGDNVKPDNLVSADKKGNLAKSIEYSKKSISASTEVGDIDQLKESYKTLHTAQKMSGKVRDAMDSYAKLIALKKTILGSKKASEIEKKGIEYENAKRLDSIQKELGKTIELTQDEKEKVSKALAETKNDLSTEKKLTSDKEKQLAIAEQKKLLLDAYVILQQTKEKLMQRELESKNNAIASQNSALDLQKKATELERREKYFYILGALALLALSVFALRSFFAEKRSNFALLREQKRSEGLLLNILPAEVAEELKEKGVADAKLFKDVTVLFTDFINFTSVAETMTPQQLVGELHICFKKFDEITKKYNVEKIKTVGDAYLAVSGLPAPNPTHATNVIGAAIEIRDYMAKRKKELGKKTFGIRIGVNSGEVVAGIVGVEKFSYDIWGDTVNVAARMEQHSEEGKINISESTYQLVKDKYPSIHRGKIEAKNKGTIDMYFIVPAKP